MPRPPKHRRVAHVPSVTYFKPAGVPLRTLEEVSVGVDELEALRLKDLAGLEQESCAREMGISQSTLQRILTAARVKVTEALVYGKAIRIEGGPFAVREPHPCDPTLPWPRRGQAGGGPPWAADGEEPSLGQNRRGRGRWDRARLRDKDRSEGPPAGEEPSRGRC